MLDGIGHLARDVVGAARAVLGLVARRGVVAAAEQIDVPLDGQLEGQRSGRPDLPTVVDQLQDRDPMRLPPNRNVFSNVDRHLFGAADERVPRRSGPRFAFVQLVQRERRPR